MIGEGEGARPELDAEALVASVPGLQAFPDLEANTVLNKPSAHLTLDDQLQICREARDAARRGIGVVVTHGTDTLEETAMLCDVVHDAEAPIVFTGAIRPASAPAPTVPPTSSTRSASRVRAAAGMGVLVCFGGEIHHARGARKTDTTSLVAFSSPQTGPLGRVTEGHPTIWSRIPRNPPLDPPKLDRRVLIVPPIAGDDGTLSRAALEHRPGRRRHRHPRRRPPDARAARDLGPARSDPGRRLLPLRARRHAQLDLRLRGIRARPARHGDHPGRLPLPRRSG